MVGVYDILLKSSVTNPGTTPITILAVNSDHGLSFAGEETRTMACFFSFALQIYSTFEFFAVQILRGLSFGLSFLILWGWGWFPHRQKCPREVSERLKSSLNTEYDRAKVPPYNGNDPPSAPCSLNALLFPPLLNKVQNKGTQGVQARYGDL